ncbi:MULTISPECIES: anaerobic ribonucleoside-triphosphate reductase [Idiomarina]|jgi:ribonucleoside-triphosphate reductase|uniref:anaerobic ribonucleoside-triphosphate reductase n=1 Tax=Idiomarina TaxID=135575 RepID=UPI0006C8CD56|nr:MULTISPECIES: anaerobic ribonucleoside-triphosphate reductase [Idiomarina]KPD21817.1 ribonucleoside-triphosphate reductase [Idiomarina abyssalis]MAL83454.1 anaerobic ribonucleoside-triphosphate reductase [Idiomarina sp.]MAO68871.1 anaerobic ribonucleoside-triphosphate reductase [Idiomarina sp.]MBF81081.1 anaerobic ribonucleoside-triphosphate reductase [Idiomarina sp.]QZN91103.1 anaerobic ribonucleoside-triphosphate reductase [Idiomarina abyssalis]|tara:strand:+ start:212962 stop:214800 length:1839 start_codon:yes stop_codon:yes gene_type:complete
MLRLNEEQVTGKVDFIHEYLHAQNAADGSKMDANANVTQKNIATLEAELMKDFFVQVNRKQVSNKISELFGNDLAKEYVRQIEDHEIYVHDETSLKPYCVSVTMYPFLRDGLTKLGGESQAPKHLESFCGTFVNFVFAVSSQFAGAVATVEFLTYFDYFARKDYGDDYLNTHRHQIENHLQHVVYALNQPAAARGYQSVFWNISIYDQHYFDSMFGEFVFPADFTKPEWSSVSALQDFFLDWFNKEREKTILTFPVVTVAMLTDDGQCKDQLFAEKIAGEMANGNSFFVYLSDNADSLASCCRLRSEISDNTFSYTLGAGGVATGSINVITMNMNRLVQDGRDLEEEVSKIHKYQVAYRKLMEEYKEAGLLTVYDAGFITLDKQFLTIGINGMVEAAESQGITAGNNQAYKDFVQSHLKVIYDANKAAKKEYGYMFNTEFVPAENLGVKNAKWDRADGYKVSRDCYNSYFYAVEDDDANALDKLVLHGKELIEYLDGGSALHLNLDEKLNTSGYLSLLNIAAKTGCNYFCINVKITICNACEQIDKRTLSECSSCGSADIDYGTRVIGYLKRVSAFSAGRRKEHHLRHYHRKQPSEVAVGAAQANIGLRKAS